MSNPLELSDEDFLKQRATPPSGESDSVVEPPVQEQTQEQTQTQEVEAPPSAGSEDNKSQEEKPSTEETDPNAKSDEADKSTEASGDKTAEADKAKAEEDPTKEKDSSATESENKKSEKAEEKTPPNYEELYNQIMAPFKANGRMIELRSPDEAIKLMQMGANYTRQMQQWAPQRKLLTMLQNNNLLDEAKLSYLIDLDKKNPDAIKKLVKDSGVDPLDINTSEEPAYTPSNHSVTDEEVNFTTALEDIQSKPNGRETLQDINTTWDQVSKEALWKQPELLSVIQTQRENGVYQQIVTEMDRQKMLGVIPSNVPFLQAYKLVGDDMVKRNAFQPPKQEVKQPTVVTERVATPKPAVSNGDKARAASPTKTSPNKAEEFKNPLAMSDDEFLQKFKGRL